MTRIVLARHGEAGYPDAEPGGILTDVGRSQAGALAESLRDCDLAAICCSELSRARRTAEIVGDRLGLPVETRAGLQEYEIGAAPGGRSALEDALLAWLAGDLEVKILGGESGAQVGGRMIVVLDDLARRYDGRTVLVISHGGAIIATLGTIAPGRTGLPTQADGRLREEDIPGGATFVLEHDVREWRIAG